MRYIVILALAGACLGCEDNEKKDFADSISGPGIDIHCFNAAANRPAVGDTNVRVTCPPGAP